MNPRAHLARVARALGTLNERVVFVGGATVDMFVTDRAAGPARFTEDVDVIVRVGSRVEFYEQIETALRAHGFKPDMRDRRGRLSRSGVGASHGRRCSQARAGIILERLRTMSAGR